MVWKTTPNIGGSSTKFGGQDLTKWSNWANAVPDVDVIDSNSQVYFRSNKTALKHATNGFSLNFVLAALSANRNINYPNLTADDEPLFKTFAAILANKTIAHGSNGNVISGINDAAIAAHTTTKITTTNRALLNSLIAYLDTVQTWTAIQKMNNQLKLLPIAVPAQDASYGQIFPDSTDLNKLKYKDPAGTLFNLLTGGSSGGSSTYVYDTYPSTYTLTADLQLSTDGKWRLKYHGSNPQNGTDVGSSGVKVPASPTNGFARVFFGQPYANTNTGSSTSADLTLTESNQFTDFDVTFYARTVQQLKSSPNAWETFWFMFRYNEADGLYFHHYYCAFKSNGRLEVGKKDNTVQIDEQYYLEAVEPTFTFTANQWNKIRIKCTGNSSVGNHIQVWIDDVLKSDILDDGSGGSQVQAPNTPAAPSARLNSGLFGLYSEDAKFEVGPITVTDLSGGTGGASTAEPYVVLASSGQLSNERILTAGAGVTITDGGPGGPITISSTSQTLQKYVTEIDVVNTNVETDILNYSVPGGTLGTNKMLRVNIKGDYLNNSGADRPFTLKIKYGATTMFADLTRQYTQSNARRPMNIEFILWARNSVNSQGVEGHLHVGVALGATTGFGDLEQDDDIDSQFLGANASENSAATKTLSVTIMHTVANSNISFRRLAAVIELL